MSSSEENQDSPRLRGIEETNLDVFKMCENFEEKTLITRNIARHYTPYFKDVLKYWFDGRSSVRTDRWFGKNPETDEYITQNFGKLLQELEKDLVDNFCVSLRDVSNPILKDGQEFVIYIMDYFELDDLIASIIVLDQFSRHVYREQPDKQDQIFMNTIMAEILSEEFFELLDMHVESGEFSDRGDWMYSKDDNEYYVTFALMPLKHLNLRENYDRIEDTIKSFQDWDISRPLTRFYKDSMEKYALLKNDVVRCNDTIQEEDRTFFSFFVYLFSNLENVVIIWVALTYLSWCYIMDLPISITIGSMMFTAFLNLKYEYFVKYPDFGSITEFLPLSFLKSEFSSNYALYSTRVSSEPIVQIVQDFLEKNLNLLGTKEENRICISLSGGVDSMVLAYVFAILRNRYNYNLIAFHINYKNRPESDQEEKFVRWYCDRLEVPIYVRRITEIQRRSKGFNRTFYEDITRKIRFDM